MKDTLEYKSYYASVHFDATEEIFHGKVLGINDLINFEGTSVRALKKAFHDAVDDYLETCARLGKEPDKAYKGSFNVRISAELHKEAVQFASIKNMTLNDFVKNAIAYVLAKAPDQFHMN